MAEIIKKIKLKGPRGEMEREALFDSGATYSCIQSELAKSLGPIDPLPKPMEFSTAEDGRKLIAKEVVRLEFYIDDCFFSDEFMVLEGLSNGVIIGAATMQKWRLKLDFEKEDIIIGRRVTRFRI